MIQLISVLMTFINGTFYNNFDAIFIENIF